jgi:lipopolysaccharide assembly outer membrane protein LptD (OstA)
MVKKILQLSLLLIIFGISVIVYKKYFTVSVKKTIKEDSTLINEDSTKDGFIRKLKYVAEDVEGNSYIIKSEIGRLVEGQPELIMMNKVIATIKFINAEEITITAENAVYNNINYDTSFTDGVTVIYSDHIITSDNLDIMFKENFASFFNNIVYKNLNAKLKADKIEMNLFTKNLEISRYDESKKIEIISTK